MALSLLCGGLGVAEASVHVNENTGGAYEVLTKQEVTDELNKKVSTEVADLKYAKASDVVTNTGNIATNTANINKLDTEKLDKDVANSTFATKDALNDLEAVVNNKMDESAVETALEVKADKATTLEGYGITDAYTKGDVDNKLNEKADAANVFTKDQTYTRDQVNTKLADYAKTTDVNTALAGKANVGDSYTKAEADGQITTAKNELGDKITANTTKIDANKTAIDDLKTKAATTETTLTDLSGRMAAAESDIGTLKADVSTAKSDIGTLKADMTTAKSDIGTLKADVSTAKSDINSLKMKDTELTGKIEAEIANRITSDTALDNKIDAEIANRITSDTALDHKIDAEIANRITSDTALDQKIDKEIQDRKNDIKATNDRTGGIARNLEGTQTTIEGIVKVDNQGNVKDVKNLGAETITTTGNAAIGGALGVTGDTTLDGALTAKGEAKFEKNVTVEKDLTVNGKLNVGEIYLENNKLEPTGKKHDSATSITADGISNLAKVTELGHTTESQFTHNEKGTFNYAKDGDSTDWTETRSDVTANGVTTEVKDSKGNRTNTSQTASENKTYLEDKDGKNTNSTIDTAKGYDKTIKGENGQTSTKQDELNITNTAEQGTIKNDAMNIENNATGDMTNNVGGNLTTTVTGQATENFNGGLDTNVTGKENHTVTGDQNIHVTGKQTNEIGGDQENTIGGNQTTTVEGNVKEDYKKDLTTTVGGNELHEVTGTKTENVTGKVIENYGNGQETNVTGDQYIHVTGKQTNKIDGDQENIIGGNQTTIVTGDISNKAENITNEANTKLTDKVGDNTRVLDSEGITDTVPGADGKGSTFKQRIDAIMGNVKTDACESEVTQKGDEITSVVGKGEATISRVTQKKGSIEAVVTDGTSFNHSRDIPVASTKTLTGYGKMNQLLDDLNSSTKTITDGTHKTSKVQTAFDITNTAADGTITNDAKNIVNNASGDMTNTVGGKLTTTVTGATEENYNGGLTTNVTGEENHTVTGKQNNKVTGKQTNTVEGGQENIISGGQTNTITGGQINNITGDQTTTITGNKTETVTENVTEDYKKNLTTTVGGNEIHEVKGTKTETVEGKVIENFKGGQETNVTGNQDIHVTGKQTNKIDGNQENTIGGDQTTNVTGDISNTAKNITNAATDTLTDKVGENTRVINSRSITDTVGRANRMIEDGKITDNAGDFTVTTDKENGTTFTNAGSTASSFTTVDGTNTGSAQGWTNVKGNEISTGKVEANYVKMDYADVMHDLGVHGSATVDNDLTVKGITTTKTLKVTENATVGGTLDVTKKATFHDDVDITKNLSVGGNATIAGDVTARSYKVDGKTYIDANGINANNQKITNVADGSISEGSKDAVNGGQLYGVKRDLEHQVDKVGANAAAMANLRPMEFDPSSKWNIAAAIGNYGSETAAAIGAFYRPNDDVMVNLSTAFGTGENMVGGGVSVRLGKGGNKLSREETNALKAQVADLTARMDALLSVLNPNMSKDFPDVPENHWAYEAVSRLAGNDIVQGYPDGEFHGERTMTRYEMAEIIYNALSRGAEAEKELVEEFKPELQAMAASEKATAEKAEG